MTRMFVGALSAVTLFTAATQAEASLSLTYAYDYEVIDPQGTMWIQAACPIGTVLLSGGWDTSTGNAPYLFVWVSRPVNNSWRVMAKNFHPSALIAVQGYAVCASGVSGLNSYVYSQVGTAPGSGGVLLICPSGGVPTGGGFDSNYPDPNQLFPKDTHPGTTQWFTQEVNPQSGNKTYTAYINCARNLPGYVTPRTSGVMIEPNSWATVSASCYTGELAVGGGFEVSSLGGSDSLMRTFSNAPMDASNWSAGAYSTSYWGAVNAYAQCLHLN